MNFWNNTCFLKSYFQIIRRLIVNFTNSLSGQIPNQNVFIFVHFNFFFILRIKDPIWKSIQFEVFPLNIMPFILDNVIILNFIARFQYGIIIFELLRSSKTLHLMTTYAFMLLIFYFLVVSVLNIALFFAHWTVFFASHELLFQLLITLSKQSLLAQYIFICFTILRIVLMNLSII